MLFPTTANELTTVFGFFISLCSLIPNPRVGKIHCLRDHWQIAMTKWIRILEFVSILVRPCHNNVEPRLPFVTGCRVQAISSAAAPTFSQMVARMLPSCIFFTGFCAIALSKQNDPLAAGRFLVDVHLLSSNHWAVKWSSQFGSIRWLSKTPSGPWPDKLKEVFHPHTWPHRLISSLPCTLFPNLQSRDE